MRRDKGIALAELMVGVAFISILGMAAFQTYLFYQNIWKRSIAQIKYQREILLTNAAILRDMRRSNWVNLYDKYDSPILASTGSYVDVGGLDWPDSKFEKFYLTGDLSSSATKTLVWAGEQSIGGVMTFVPRRQFSISDLQFRMLDEDVIEINVETRSGDPSIPPDGILSKTQVRIRAPRKLER